jgi:GNAT superfamily N-acetyltransferase
MCKGKNMIRKATKEEYPILAKLFVDNVDNTYITSSEEECGRTINGIWKPNLYDIVLQEMIDRSNNIFILVLIVENIIVGYSFSSIEAIPHIEDIIIDKKYRGFGYGKKLVKETINWFNNNGYKKFRVEIGKDNIVSQNMIKKFDCITVKIN